MVRTTMAIGQKNQKIRVGTGGRLGFITVGKGNVAKLGPQMEKMKKCAADNRGKKKGAFQSGMRACLAGRA